ncbi:MAG TPA: cysteine--tRNA ligase [Frankiaceae bacterium]|nr:cysteine--tRNA ligase [Frankiaceae bacterium]
MPTLQLAGSPLPVIGRARMYVCGITPYDVTHLGHASTFVWSDLATRVLHGLCGVPVDVCRNVTDVDDDMLAAARRAEVHYDQLAAVQQFDFEQDMAALGVRAPTFAPRVHQHVDDVIALAAALIESGAAYESGGSVWFRGSGVASRAGLTDEQATELGRAGGHPADEPGRADHFDVPIWQHAGDSTEPAWPSPWGPGRPGWHAGCTVMALARLGSSLDLHAGGADLRYPHHAYESAMAESVSGVTPFARAWLHVGTVRIDGRKMAKSTGNLVLVRDLLKTTRPAALRLALLDRPWAQPWDFSEDVLAAADQRLEDLYSAAGQPGEAADSVTEAMTAALLNDLDVSAALDIVLDGPAGGGAARQAVRLLGLPA